MTDPFDFDIDINDSDISGSQSVDTAVKEAVKAIEKEPEVPKQEEPKETPKEQAEEVDIKGYSNAALFALSFQKEKGLFAEDLVIKKDLTPEELQEMLLDAATNIRDEDKEKYLEQQEEEARQRLTEKGLTDAHLTYIQQIINGADPQIISRVAQYRSWSEAELEGEEEMEAAIRAGMRLQLSNNPNADDLIDAYMEKNVKDKGTEVLQEKAQEWQGYIGKVADYLESEDNKRIEAAKTHVQEIETRFASDVEKQLQTGVAGIEFKKSQQKDMLDYMTKKTEVIEVETPQGRKRIKVTKEEADRRKDSLDINKRILEAYQRKTGFTKLVNAAHQTAQDKFLKGIKATDEPKRQVALPQGVDDAADYIEI